MVDIATRYGLRLPGKKRPAHGFDPKNGYSYTCTPRLCLYDLLYGKLYLFYEDLQCSVRLCHWPSGLKLRSTADRVLGLWVRRPPATWMSVYCECGVW